MFLKNDTLGVYIQGEEFTKVTKMRFLEKEQKGIYRLGFFRRMKGIYLLRLVFACVRFFFFARYTWTN